MREKKISSATPVTISGTISGWLMKAYLKVRPRIGRRARGGERRHGGGDGGDDGRDGGDLRASASVAS